MFPLPPSPHLPWFCHLALLCTFVNLREPILILFTEICLLHEGPVFVLWHFMGLDKCVMMYIHHPDIAQNNSKVLNMFHLFLLLFPQLLMTKDLFIVSIVLSLPDHHTIGIKKYADFSNQLLLLSNKSFMSLPVFSWPDSSFHLGIVFRLVNIPVFDSFIYILKDIMFF